MLELRPNCEHCNQDLSPDSQDAMICSFECTFCKDCAINLLKNVCPNCAGGFYARPIRPKNALTKYPASLKRIHQPVDMKKHSSLVSEYDAFPPELR